MKPAPSTLKIIVDCRNGAAALRSLAEGCQEETRRTCLRIADTCDASARIIEELSRQTARMG